MVEKYKVTQFYTAPTAIRALMRFGDDPVKKHDLRSLRYDGFFDFGLNVKQIIIFRCRILGSVGEPINPEAWLWYYNVVGNGKCSIVDTFWQTETGGHVITPLPGATPMKPGSAVYFVNRIILLYLFSKNIFSNSPSHSLASSL